MEPFLTALGQPSQKILPKILTPQFYSNLYLHFLRPCCENIFKIVCIVSEKINLLYCYTYIYNLLYCSSLQPVVCFNFTEIENTFPVLFWDYKANCLWLCSMVCICLIQKGKNEWFFHEGLLLDWLIFLLHLLQSICCSKYSAKITSFLS